MSTKWVIGVGVDLGSWLELESGVVHQGWVLELLKRLLEIYWVSLPRSFDWCFWGHSSYWDF